MQATFLRPWSLLLLCCLGLVGAVPMAAQEGPALPQDARSLLLYQRSLEGLAPTVRASDAHTLQRAYVYLLAGAEGELREEIQNLSEEHPDALRFALQADCWNPHTFADGRRRAVTWLARHSDRSAAEVEDVTAVQEWLEEAETRREDLQRQRGRSRWYPLAAGLGVLLCVGLVLRLLP